jgi:N-acetylmuramoyl-L-alanine amidase
MQDKYIDKSVQIASDIQENFAKKCKRKDRGVRQAGFWVLHRTAMPSILVELGYISNPEEERFLNSSQGQKQLAESIYDAFLKYKHEHEKKSGKQNNSVSITTSEENIDTSKIELAPQEKIQSSIEVPMPPALQKKPLQPSTEAVATDEAPIFKIQLLASKEPIENKAQFKGLKVDYFIEGGYYKYTYGNTSSFKEINKMRKEILGKFKDAFVIAFKNGKKISAQDAVRK